MNKKIGIVVLVLIIAAALTGWFFYRQRPQPTFLSPGSQTELDRLANDPIKLNSLIKNSTVSIRNFGGRGNEEMVSTTTLKDGVGEFVMDPESNFKGDVFVNSILGQVKTLDGYDIFADMAINTGGTGIFHSVAIFRLNSNSVEYMSNGDIGDRVKMLAAAASPNGSNSYLLDVKYLDRKDNEPMSADPTVPKEAKFQVVDHLIKQ